MSRSKYILFFLILLVASSCSKQNDQFTLEAQFKFSQLRIATNMGTFPVVLKEALKLIGYDCGDCVKPIQPLSEEQRGKLRGVLTDMGLL